MIPLLKLENIHKIYSTTSVKVHAVNDVSFEIFPGTLTLLMGPSGSGKTTLLSIMGCILKPSEGRLTVIDRQVDWVERTLPLIRRNNFGFIFQHFNLISALNARENVEVALNLKGLSGKTASQKAKEMLTAVGLSKRIEFFPTDMSGGEKQRVAIARALCMDPPIILGDEPTGNLDSLTGISIIEVLKKLAKEEKKSVVIVTHDVRLISLADRVINMEDGRVII